MMRIFFLLTICLSLFLSLTVNGQKSLTINYRLTDSVTPGKSELLKELNEEKKFPDTLRARQYIHDWLQSARDVGYLTASADSLRLDENIYRVSLFLGQQYKWAKLSKGNTDDVFLTGADYRERLYTGRPFRFDRVSRMLESILKNAENNGYPFASIQLDSISIREDSITASLNFDKGKLVVIDSIVIKGDAAIAPVYVYSYTGIFPGSVYDESKISRLSFRLKEVAFLQEALPPQVVFTEKSTELYLYLKPRKASQFDGIVGLLPDETKPGSFQLTGEAHLKLQNSLKRGEIIELNWKQLPLKSQDLKVRLFYPFLFNTPFGLDGNLTLYKKDTTYIDVIKNLGVQYIFSGNNYLKAFVTDKESNLQTATGLENITVLPAYADIHSVSYGLTFHFEDLDYRLNPGRGIAFEVTGSTGNRSIRRNSEINPVVYDSVDLKTTNYQFEANADRYFTLFPRSVLNAGVAGGYLFNEEIFINELFRIGGLRSLRGFDEQSIYASSFVIGKIEYRYILEQNSFLFAFYNHAWYENNSRGEYVRDTPSGYGAGINFETKLGIMSVSYALGRQQDNPVQFRNGKIHFGIVNYF